MGLFIDKDRVTGSMTIKSGNSLDISNVYIFRPGHGPSTKVNLLFNKFVHQRNMLQHFVNIERCQYLSISHFTGYLIQFA